VIGASVLTLSSPPALFLSRVVFPFFWCDLVDFLLPLLLLLAGFLRSSCGSHECNVFLALFLLLSFFISISPALLSDLVSPPHLLHMDVMWMYVFVCFFVSTCSSPHSNPVHGLAIARAVIGDTVISCPHMQAERAPPSCGKQILLPSLRRDPSCRE
jgi:hypothetical protein